MRAVLRRLGSSRPLGVSEGADGLRVDLADDLVTGNDQLRRISALPLDRQGIAMADSARHDANAHVAGFGVSQRSIDEGEGARAGDLEGPIGRHGSSAPEIRAARHRHSDHLDGHVPADSQLTDSVDEAPVARSR